MDPAASITPLSQHLYPPPCVSRGHFLLGHAPVTPGSAVPPLLWAPAPPQLVPSGHTCPARDQPAQPHWSLCPSLAPGPPPPLPRCPLLDVITLSACPQVHTPSCLVPAPDTHHPHLQPHSSKYLWVPPRARPCARCPGVSKVPGPCFRAPSMQSRSRPLRDHRSLHLPRYPNQNCASSEVPQLAPLPPGGDRSRSLLGPPAKGRG